MPCHRGVEEGAILHRQPGRLARRYLDQVTSEWGAEFIGDHAVNSPSRRGKLGICTLIQINAICKWVDSISRTQKNLAGTAAWLNRLQDSTLASGAILE
jgi:hypothetical protein